MIIKSMSRKAPSFSQLIDYLEAGSSSHCFSVFHNTYSRGSEALKAEFQENAERLKFRKNGVYLYHEVISITRSQNTHEDRQKEALQKIVREYLKMRAGKQLAYAVLHDDKKDNLHFHLVISANEAENETRKRLSKADFATLQTQLEKWTLETFPELEQQAVFAPNQTDQEKQEHQRKARISNDGAELKRRGGKTTERDTMKETLERIFATATSGQHFTELMNTAGLKLYQRGKNYGVTTEDGTKYRFATLGLAKEWEEVSQRIAVHQRATDTIQNTVRGSVETALGQTEEALERDQEKPEQKARQETFGSKIRDALYNGVKMIDDTTRTVIETALHGKQPHKTQAKPRQEAETLQDTHQDGSKQQSASEHTHTSTTDDEQKAENDPIEAEMKRRTEEMKARRNKQHTAQTSTGQKHQP